MENMEVTADTILVYIASMLVVQMGMTTGQPIITLIGAIAGYCNKPIAKWISRNAGGIKWNKENTK